MGSFIMIWLSSLLSPAILAACFIYKYYLCAMALVVVAILSYLPWSKQGGRFVQELFHNCHPAYYKQVSLEFEGNTSLPSPNDPQTFYAVHPHGAFCLGWSHLFALPCLNHVRFCFSPVLFMSPLFRFFSRCVGNPGSASKKDMMAYMKRGESLALPPGGFEEATLTDLHQDRVFIKKRTGFIKLCLMSGTVKQIRPVYVFGEKKLFWNFQGGWKFRLAMNHLYGLPMILVWGCSFFPVLPKMGQSLKIVVGPPLEVPDNLRNPSKEDVLLWHGKYIAALTKLFEDHKEEAYGAEFAKTAKLEIW